MIIWWGFLANVRPISFLHLIYLPSALERSSDSIKPQGNKLYQSEDPNKLQGLMKVSLSSPYFFWRTSVYCRMLPLLYALLLWAAWAQFPVVKTKDAVEESKTSDSFMADTSQTHRVSSGLMQCGEYSNEVMPNGQCRLIATLPQLEEHRCPDMFRCTDEVSYWLRENKERKQQMEDLKETISELQEELRNHRHRIKVLELQVGS